MVTNNRGSSSYCAGCSNKILDRFVYTVIGCTWHAECVRCCICQQLLTEKCYTKTQRLYCRDDYFRRHGFDCSGCHQPIHASDFVRKINNQMIYHIGCIVCYRCGRSLDTGEDVYIVSTNDFTEQLICSQDYLELYAICQAQDVNNNTRAATNSVSASIISNTTRDADGASLDHLPSQQQHSLHYHQNSLPTNTAIQFDGASSADVPCATGGIILDQHHHQQQTMFHSPASIMSLSNDASSSNTTTDTYRTSSTPFIECINQAATSRDTKSSFDNRPASSTVLCGSPVSKLDSTQESEESECSDITANADQGMECTQSFDLQDNSSSGKNDPNQCKRGPRTAIKNDQLQMLCDAFLTCQKPSKKMRECLANQTGLSTRVIQVWFQNRRSKERRTLHVDVKPSNSDSNHFGLNSANTMDSEYFTSPRR
ncbi:hypothetical protein GJ496_004318 [Pomphorhynchus laevis]|nr:hypothetical protein GJ496_004318 [Pomphorhynchus laevis]